MIVFRIPNSLVTQWLVANVLFAVGGTSGSGCCLKQVVGELVFALVSCGSMMCRVVEQEGPTPKSKKKARSKPLSIG